ncbi:hypothetical protein NliqN6_3278 [Naganishia liquefaciens]|uniref:RNA helicase n=1 Tax=Naganishia liquefaciens TaxID=104408 RepID=A0A8H3YGP5_9TREE|nr:hypothetical protein NliqN6_3278 [Naganishia liquefaciens]
MPTSSIWGHPNHITGPSPNKVNTLSNGTPLLRDSARPTSVGTSASYQSSYQQQQSQPSPFPQPPFNPRLSTSSVSSTGSAAPVIPMSPGQHSVSTSAGGGASSLGMGNDGSVYLSAASSLAGGMGTVNENIAGVDGQGYRNTDSGFTIRENAGYEGYDGYETAAPMQMPINLEEDEDIPYSRGQGYAHQTTSANPNINLYQRSDEAYLPAHQSQPMSIPFTSPGRLGPAGVEQYEGHLGHQMYPAAHGGPGGSAGNGNRKLQQPSPSRVPGPVGASISPLPWGRNNGITANFRQQSANNGPMQLRGVLVAQNQPSGSERPTSAMSGRGQPHGDPTNQREGTNIGKENGNAASNADGLQGLGIARAESPAMAELIARVARTEAALADLNQQVASLNTLVKGLQISATTPSPSPFGGSHMGMGGNNSGSVFANEGRLSVPLISRPASAAPTMVSHDSHSTATPTGPASSTPVGSSPRTKIRQQQQSHDITNLTQQIAALSSSVAQLQRMQTARQSLGAGQTMDRKTSPGSEPERSPLDTNTSSNDNVAAGTEMTSPSSRNVQPIPQRLGEPREVREMSLNMASNGPPSAPVATASTLSMTPSTLSITSPISVGVGGSQGQQGYFPQMMGPVGGNAVGMSGRPVPGPRHLSQNIVSGNGAQNTSEMAQPPQSSANGLQNHLSGSLRARPNVGRSISSSVINSHHHGGQGGNGQGYNDWHGGNGNSNSAKPSFIANGMSTPSLTGGPGQRGDPPTPGGTGPAPAGILVSKWEHLPLSMDLQRQIVKYGIGPPNKIQSRALPFMLKGSDIIAQAPPTQERIITYVIPVVQLCLALVNMQQQQQGQQQGQQLYTGPCAIIVTTTVDQATQAHKLVRDIGAPLGIRSALAVGASGADISNDLRMMHQNRIQIVVGTPARLHDVFVKYAGNGGLPGAEVRMLVLDEVDQLIARNLYENVSGIVRLLPPPRTKASNSNNTTGISIPGPSGGYDANFPSPFYPTSPMPFPAGSGNASQPNGRSNAASGMQLSVNPERQTCIFSNTIPTDVINFSQSIQVREPVRVLVRREGGPGGSNESSTAGNLRHYYLYLALAGGASGRTERDAFANAGPGTIGSGRSAQRQPDSETNKSKEYKLEALVDLLQEYPLWQAIIHVGSQSTMEAVLSKLSSRQMEGIALTQDMPAHTRQAVLNKWRQSAQTGRGARFLVAYDVVIKSPEVSQCPLVINYDLPRSVEGYAQRVAPALSSSNTTGSNNRRGNEQASSVILNFIQAAGGDVEMLRSTECAYRFKCSEVPSSFRDLF